MENKFLGVMSFTVLVEGCITYINKFLVQGYFPWEMLLSIIFGIVVSVAYNLDIPSYFNFKSTVPLVGNLAVRKVYILFLLPPFWASTY